MVGSGGAIGVLYGAKHVLVMKMGKPKFCSTGLPVWRWVEWDARLELCSDWRTVLVRGGAHAHGSDPLFTLSPMHSKPNKEK